jgi:hypothetical protein
MSPILNLLTEIWRESDCRPFLKMSVPILDIPEWFSSQTYSQLLLKRRCVETLQLDGVLMQICLMYNIQLKLV